MISDRHIPQEQAWLEEALPESTFLVHNKSHDLYAVMYKPGPARPYNSTLVRVPRANIKVWTRPRKVLNYVARRVLYEKNAPVEMRAGGSSASRAVE